jgi:transcriptional regulator with XRE-family HTH domain
VQTAPFHTALRLAIEDRGLALTRICDRLTERGVRLSVSTLSNWQRGISRPERPGSLRALSTLEDVLGLSAGALGGLLEERRQAGRWRELGPGTSRHLAQRLRARLGEHDRGHLTLVSVQEDVVLGLKESRWLARNRLVVQAGESGTGRHVVLFHTQAGALPTLHAGTGCRVGRVLSDDPAGLVAAELLFPALARGETYPLEYSLRGHDHGRYHGRWFGADVHHRYDLTLRFRPELAVRAAHRIWRLDALSPHKDVAELRLIGNELVHLVEPDPQPGFHGIRWE